ncbi:FecR domain-containing protein [Parabacteroides goldsteinii]|uniref:FecR family protein n=1 Tax=Parabacteroides goldsteinii TaxID=328812 RepID=UPI001CCF661D|nr:FecR domain-containing protein [Parabacteroides goldsteinii]UBD73946.1 FecR domain-containing protein [Parabacteroides goldsteinii]
MRIELLHRLIAGTTTEEENRQLMEWFRQCASKEEFFMLFETAWKESPDEMPRDVQERMYRRLSRELDEKKTKTILLRSRFSWKVWQQIAVACIIIVLGLVNYRMIDKQKQLSTQNFMVLAEKGQRAFITLPDSTKVWLNSDTKISYPADYGLKERNVTLVGEAYFEVAKNPDKRFIVEAKGMQVEALGTSFNVNAYQNDNKIIASLFSGSVRVSYDRHVAILKPHESVKVDLLNRSFSRYKDESMQNIALWRKNEITFDGESLEEITHIMSRLYNTTICIEDESLKKVCYIGTIRNNNLENFIDIINLTTPVVYENKGDTVFLRKRVP